MKKEYSHKDASGQDIKRGDKILATKWGTTTLFKGVVVWLTPKMVCVELEKRFRGKVRSYKFPSQIAVVGN